MVPFVSGEYLNTYRPSHRHGIVMFHVEPGLGYTDTRRDFAISGNLL